MQRETINVIVRPDQKEFLLAFAEMRGVKLSSLMRTLTLDAAREEKQKYPAEFDRALVKVKEGISIPSRQSKHREAV